MAPVSLHAACLKVQELQHLTRERRKGAEERRRASVAALSQKDVCVCATQTLAPSMVHAWT